MWRATTLFLLLLPAWLMHAQVTGSTLTPNDLPKIQKKAEAGDIRSQLDLARAFEEGNTVPQSNENAVLWYRKAADQGNPDAQNQLANMYRQGTGVEKNKEEAVKWYRLAAKGGSAAGMFNLGTAYYNCDGVQIDDAAAYAWFILAKKAGSKAAVDAVAREESELKAWTIIDGLTKAAQMFESGDGLPQDYASAAYWYRAAAEKGDPEAQVHLAVMLLQGQGVPKSDQEAHDWCERAAKTQSPAGDTCLGLMLRKGIGTERNPKKAVEYLLKGAGRGNVKAKDILGEMYESGELGKVDRPRAFLYYFQAAYVGDGKYSGEAFIRAAKVRAAMSDKEWKATVNNLKASNINIAALESALQKALSPN